MQIKQIIKKYLDIIFVCFILPFSFLIWRLKGRDYSNKHSVASSYNDWTKDRLLEVLWGDHVHLGYYRRSLGKRDFRQAKVDFVHELVRWSGLNNLPRGSRILDVGCGIGGSSRILARDYGFDVIGISISEAQIKRSNQLTPEDDTCRFQVMDAMDLKFEKGSFDGVWSVEAAPHMPDKQLYADEMLRVLRPGGVLVVADWNCRDITNKKMNVLEKLVMHQLLNQWTHPEFSSIKNFTKYLSTSRYTGGLVENADWTEYTIKSWNDSILEGIRRPNVFLELGVKSFFQGIREIPTILLMRWAFSNGLMQFGVFKTRG